MVPSIIGYNGNNICLLFDDVDFTSVYDIIGSILTFDIFEALDLVN